jgi:hypothetical protein
MAAMHALGGMPARVMVADGELAVMPWSHGSSNDILTLRGIALCRRQEYR